VSATVCERDHACDGAAVTRLRRSFVGNLHNSEHMSGTGLALTWMNVLIACGAGVLNAISTLVPQAMGDNNNRMVGATLQRGILVSLILAAIICVLWVSRRAGWAVDWEPRGVPFCFAVLLFCWAIVLPCVALFRVAGAVPVRASRDRSEQRDGPRRRRLRELDDDGAAGDHGVPRSAGIPSRPGAITSRTLASSRCCLSTRGVPWR
jgi:hypothetical protein